MPARRSRQCPACSATLSGDTPWCLSCGTVLGWDCAACGNTNRSGDHFCWRCGTAANPAQRGVLANERKLVTALMADIRGSFALIHGRDIEQIQVILGRSIEMMRRAVHEFGGTVTRIQGDGILAVFGAPAAMEDHAIRACHAALRVAEAARDARQDETGAIEIRIGLSSGEVLLTTISSDTATNYDAVGEVIHLAARMEQSAEPGSVVISNTTARLIEGYFDLRPLGPTPVKGLPQPIETFVLLAPKVNRSRLAAAGERGLTPMVNRSSELAAIARLRHQVLGGAARTLLVRADAGQGKSRLVHEAIVARPDGWTVRVAHAVPFGRASFRTARDLLAAVLGLANHDLTAAQLPPDTIQPLAALFGQEVDDLGWRDLEAGERLHRIHEAAYTILRTASRAAPLALVVEDVHWIDTESAALLRDLMARSGSGRVLLALTCRSEFEPAWARSAICTEIALRPLSTPDMQTLFGHLLEPRGRDPNALKSLVIERSAGNPFFLEESLAAFADEGTLARAGGRYRLVRNPAAGGAPIAQSIRSLLAARIDRLGRTEKSLLQVAAIAGMSGTTALLRDLAELDMPMLQAALDRLAARDFLRLTHQPEPTWRFRHALTHDTAYAGVPRTRRIEIHRRVLAVLTAERPDRVREGLELLAYHAEQGELWAEAAEHAYEAGKAAAWWRRDNDEALRLFRQALSCLERLPDGPEKFRRALDLQLAMRQPLMVLGRIPALLETLAAADRLARNLADPARLGLCLVLRCHAFWLVGDPDAALRVTQEAIAIATETGDAALAARARYQYGLVCYSLSDHRQAVASLAEALPASDSDPTAQGYQLGPQISVTALSYMARSLAETGRFADALAFLARARRISDSLGDPVSLITVLMALGQVRLRCNEPGLAMEALETALAMKAEGHRVLAPVVASLLGTVRLRTGDVAAGIELLEQAIEDAERIGLKVQQPARLAALAEGYEAAGRTRDAIAAARKAIRTGTRQQERGTIVLALLTTAQAIAARRPRAAHRFLQKARDEGRRLSMTPAAQACDEMIASLLSQPRWAEPARLQSPRAPAEAPPLHHAAESPADT